MQGSVKEHIDAATLESYFLEELEPEAQEDAEGHLLVCTTCRSRLDYRSLNIDTFDAICVLRVMPFPRKRSPVQFSEQEMLKLESIRKSRTEEKRRTLRAAFLLDSLSGQSDEAIAQHYHVSRSVHATLMSPGENTQSLLPTCVVIRS